MQDSLHNTKNCTRVACGASGITIGAVCLVLYSCSFDARQKNPKIVMPDPVVEPIQPPETVHAVSVGWSGNSDDFILPQQGVANAPIVRDALVGWQNANLALETEEENGIPSIQIWIRQDLGVVEIRRSKYLAESQKHGISGRVYTYVWHMPYDQYQGDIKIPAQEQGKTITEIFDSFFEQKENGLVQPDHEPNLIIEAYTDNGALHETQYFWLNPGADSKNLPRAVTLYQDGRTRITRPDESWILFKRDGSIQARHGVELVEAMRQNQGRSQ